jgi:hypothetical protein
MAIRVSRRLFIKELIYNIYYEKITRFECVVVIVLVVMVVAVAAAVDDNSCRTRHVSLCRSMQCTAAKASI